MKYPNTYAVYDLETTGLDPMRDEAIEIGLLIVRNGRPDPVRSWLIRPATALSEATVSITGITQAEVDEKGGKSHDCWRDFFRAVKGLPLVGHNISRFDNDFLGVAFAKYGPGCAGIETPSHLCGLHNWRPFPHLSPSFVDTAAIYKAGELKEDQRWDEAHMDFARRVLSIKAYGVRYKLVDLYQKYGGDTANIQAHRAEGDVEMTNFIYRVLVALPEPKAEQKALL